MSIKSASEFCSDICKDKNLASKFADLNGKELTEEVFKERFVPILKEKRYNFTYLELIEACKHRKKLNENELSHVVGGGVSGAGFREGTGIGKKSSGVKSNKDYDVNIDVSIFSNGKIFNIDVQNMER